MDPNTQKIFDRIDQKMDALIKELENMPEEKLQQHPEPGAWSVLEVMYHLMLSEKLSRAYIQKKLSFKPDLPANNWSARLRSFLLDTYNRGPIKRKAPQNVSESQFPKDLTFVGVVTEWKNERQTLRTYLEGLEPALYQKQVYRHPFGGRLSLAAMVSFFNSHFDRHYKQIRRVLSSIS